MSAEPITYGSEMADASILVIDDEIGMRNFLTKILEPRCKLVEQAGSAAQAEALLDKRHFDLVILDNVMPRKSGLAWIAEQRRVGFYADAIMITAYADLETVIEAMRAGVSDFVLKPFRSNQILTAVARVLDRKNLRRENYLLRHELLAEASNARGKLVGTSPALEEVRAMLGKLSALPTPVLFTGESGTGKELAARTLHTMSDRGERPFVAVNCASIPPDRIAEELFGAIGADGRPRDGLLRHADGGTLFFDEVAQMPEPLQVALLRVLEDHRVRPVGAERELPLDLRFLFATNDDLDRLVAEGKFRADLYHRINVVGIRMPSLRDRADDIVELATLFMMKFSQSMGKSELALDEETLLKLRLYDWPGNVRELRNLVERSVILGQFPEEFRGAGEITGARAVEDLDLVVQRHILHMLDRCGGNRAETARRLGVSRKTIDRKLAAWAID